MGSLDRVSNKRHGVTATKDDGVDVRGVRNQADTPGAQ